MKLVVVIFVFALATYADQQTAPPPDASDDCIKESGVDIKFVRNLETKGEFADDPKLKCYIKCMGVKEGGVTETGEVIVDDLKTKMGQAGLTDQQITEMVDPCKDLKGSDPCDTAYVVAKCMVEQAITKVFVNTTVVN